MLYIILAFWFLAFVLYDIYYVLFKYKVEAQSLRQCTLVHEEGGKTRQALLDIRETGTMSHAVCSWHLSFVHFRFNNYEPQGLPKSLKLFIFRLRSCLES